MASSRYELRRWFVKGAFWCFNLYLWSFLGLLIGSMEWMVQLNLQTVLYSFVGFMVVGIIAFMLYGVWWSRRFKRRLSLFERACMRDNPVCEWLPCFDITMALASLAAFLVVIGAHVVAVNACGLEMIMPFPENLVLPALITALIAGLWSALYNQIVEWVRMDAEYVAKRAKK